MSSTIEICYTFQPLESMGIIYSIYSGYNISYKRACVIYNCERVKSIGIY